MKQISLLVLLAVPRAAQADHTWLDLGEDRPHAVSAPEVIIAAGASTNGATGEIELGYAWGRSDGAFVPEVRLSRVVVGARLEQNASPTSSLTYGWCYRSVINAALDMGVEGSTTSGGPTARATIGYGLVAARVGASFMIGEDENQWVGRAEVVLDVVALLSTDR
jgi:hypothetical protein